MFIYGIEWVRVIFMASRNNWPQWRSPLFLPSTNTWGPSFVFCWCFAAILRSLAFDLTGRLQGRWVVLVVGFLLQHRRAGSRSGGAHPAETARAAARAAKAKRALAAAKRKANKAKPQGGTAFQLSFVWAPDTRLRPAASHHRDVAGRAHGVEAPYPQIYTFCLGSKPLHGVGFGFQTFRWCCHITQTKAGRFDFLVLTSDVAVDQLLLDLATVTKTIAAAPCCLIQGGQLRRDPACRGSVVRDHAARMAHARSKRARGMDETLACLWFWICIFSWALCQDTDKISDRIKKLEEKNKAAKKLQRQAALEHKKAEKSSRSRSRSSGRRRQP